MENNKKLAVRLQHYFYPFQAGIPFYIAQSVVTEITNPLTYQV